MKKEKLNWYNYQGLAHFECEKEIGNRYQQTLKDQESKLEGENDTRRKRRRMLN